jgi:hypothetical protein
VFANWTWTKKWAVIKLHCQAQQAVFQTACHEGYLHDGRQDDFDVLEY